jgi:hypothetical protein
MALIPSKVKEAESVEGTGIKSTGEPANEVIVSDGSGGVTWQTSSSTDEKVKVGTSGTPDYLNDTEFQQDGTNHITILELAWSKISKAGSSLADLATRNHSDLQGIGANDHHAQVHDINGTDHTGTLDWSKVDKTGANVSDLTNDAGYQTSSDVDSKISTHKSDASAHHTKYTDSDAVAAMGTKSDTNPLNHDKPTIYSAKATYTNGGLAFSFSKTFTNPVVTIGIEDRGAVSGLLGYSAWIKNGTLSGTGCTVIVYKTYSGAWSDTTEECADDDVYIHITVQEVS